ncbi:HlyD family secretion protein [Vibrio mediterranei]|uniref:HlyD family secretion protein n=1 Tax=Vibrio mediterranei TaxID=689 RepID=UPI00148B6B67|nr:biotin/lipoyl-binding protein [Vibrio mediterranei]NOH31741.1 HlyD family secretion protein [Vibrio mediterranei]
METLITLSYIALCVIVFRVFKVPQNKWTITTAAVIGMFLVGWIFLYMAMYQPVARVAGVYSITTPITSEVSGIVKKVYVEGNVPLKQGEPLYQIDPVPFQAEVDKVYAQLIGVDAKIKQLELSKNVTQEAINKTQASIEFNKKELARFSKLAKKDFSAQQQVDKFADTVTELTAVQNQNHIQLAILDSQIEEQDANEALYRASLDKAQFNLDSTMVRAPTDGYVTQVALRPGMKSRVVPFQGNLTFVHKEDKVIFAAFKQNPARYIKKGYEAEVTFKTIPGHAYKATVTNVLDIAKQGAVAPSGVLNDPLARMGGRILVRIEIDEPELLAGQPIPAGTDAHVAVYSPEWEMFSVVRKVILRMQSWQNWLFEG